MLSIQDKILGHVKRKQLIILVILLKVFLSLPIHSPEGKKLNHSHAVYFPGLTTFTLILDLRFDLKWL